MKLLNDAELERSWAVANASMNRDRGLSGVNCYTKELGFSPLDFLNDLLLTHKTVAWLDLCCGNGRALREAACELKQQSSPYQMELVGVDLVSTWSAKQSEEVMDFKVASLHQWAPQRAFDLITCVHGLHYLGDKLRIVERAAGWLLPSGRFAAHLDLTNLRFGNGRSMNRSLLKQFGAFGLTYDRRRRLLVVDGLRSLDFGYHYLGADDEAGPNFTGQRAVNSFYKR
jgi:SAM-dependent methyltransferase